MYRALSSQSYMVAHPIGGYGLGHSHSLDVFLSMTSKVLCTFSRLTIQCRSMSLYRDEKIFNWLDKISFQIYVLFESFISLKLFVLFFFFLYLKNVGTNSLSVVFKCEDL